MSSNVDIATLDACILDKKHGCAYFDEGFFDDNDFDIQLCILCDKINLTIGKRRGQLFPNRCPPGYPLQNPTNLSKPTNLSVALAINVALHTDYG